LEVLAMVRRQKPFEIDAVQLMQRMTIQVKIKKEREMRTRIWIATRLIIFAAFITGMGIEFGDENHDDN
jgi:hypothetical protein